MTRQQKREIISSVLLLSASAHCSNSQLTRLTVTSKPFIFTFCFQPLGLRTASIRSWLKALAVNLSRPFGWLWLYASSTTLAGSKQTLLSVQSFFFFPRVWVGKCFSWYRLTWVVPDKGPLNGCVCMCIQPLSLIHLVQSNSSMHRYKRLVLCKDTSLQRGRFCTRSLASCIPRSSKERSSWMFFVQVVRGRPSNRLQFSGGGSKMAWPASALHLVAHQNNNNRDPAQQQHFR